MKKARESQQNKCTFCVRTYLCFVFVELTDLLSFPLHLQQQPLLLPLKVFSLPLRDAGLQLSRQFVLLPACTHNPVKYYSKQFTPDIALMQLHSQAHESQLLL